MLDSVSKVGAISYLNVGFPPQMQSGVIIIIVYLLLLFILFFTMIVHFLQFL